MASEQGEGLTEKLNKLLPARAKTKKPDDFSWHSQDARHLGRQEPNRDFHLRTSVFEESRGSRFPLAVKIALLGVGVIFAWAVRSKLSEISRRNTHFLSKEARPSLTSILTRTFSRRQKTSKRPFSM